MNFSGAIGSFKITTRAVPTTIQAEEPILFTLHVEGVGNLREFSRPSFDKILEWRKRFHIAQGSERYLPSEKAREFDYVLRPRNATVNEIPPLAFDYYKPGFLPPEKGFQTAYARAIALKIAPRHQAARSDSDNGRAFPELPASVRVFPEASRLIQAQAFHWGSQWSPPLWAFALILFLPPLAVVSVHLARRYSRSPAASISLRQRSRAAQRAFDASRALLELAVSSQPSCAGEIVSDYLRAHHSSLPLEPTSREIAEFLRSRNALPATIQMASSFFDRCAANRFGRDLANHEDWRLLTNDLISALEADPCLACKC